MDNKALAPPRVSRTGATLIYLVLITFVHWRWIGDGFELDFKILWFVNGVAALLFGSRLLNPHYTTTPAAASYAFVALSTLVLAFASDTLTANDHGLIWVTVVFLGIVFLLAIMTLVFRRDGELETRDWILSSEAFAKWAGSPLIAFSLVILVMTWLFHRATTTEVFAILAVWTGIVAINPIEAIWSWVERLLAPSGNAPQDMVGQIVAHQNPGLVLIRQLDDQRLSLGTLLALSDEHGPTTLGVALNYVGRDEGVLLRALSLPFPKGVLTKAQSAAVGHGIATKLNLDTETKAEVDLLNRIESFCGIVDVDSNLEAVQIEIVNQDDLHEGRLVDVMIGDNRVIYQIVDGITREEAVQQKNKYGFARARARKVGRWIADKHNFEPVPWLPQLNAPVFLRTTTEYQTEAAAVGHFPRTNYSVAINTSELVTHNTAILGILGIGKSYLAIELVERMFRDSIKVICLDLTDQYADLLSDFVDNDFQKQMNEALHEAGKGRPVDKGKAEGGSAGKFYAQAKERMKEFLSDDCDQKIWILNPANFRVSQQTTNAYGDEAAFRDLSPSEITACISDAALKVCQELGMTDKARACLIFEEAHTLVPEWNSVAAEGDKNATSASARAILQGRKFGLGCLLITQRTANVTKTILNQCNTIFAMRTFDDTGREFLSNYIGRDYAGVLPSLQERHAVLFGKASSCDNPVLLRLNDRDKFIDAFRGPKEQVEVPASDGEESETIVTE